MENEDVKVATRIALVFISLFVSIAGCTYGVAVEDGKTERACIASGLDSNCNTPDGD